MVTLLITVIYIAFIGLGLPQTVFGAALPAISAELGDNINYISVIVSGCTVVSSVFGARLAKRFGTGVIAFASAALAALSLLGFSISSSAVMMCLFAVPLGLSSGATDAALNNYVALNLSARHMSFLHCFYGIGFLLSPSILSAVLRNNSWQAGYVSVFAVQGAIAIILLLSLPLWKKASEKNDLQIDGNQKKSASVMSVIKNPTLWKNWGMGISANAVESAVGMWGSTYLVAFHGFDEAAGAAGITLFYIGVALGRFLSGIISTRLNEKRTIFVGSILMILGIAIMFIPQSSVALAGLFLVGFGNGPIHPNLYHLTPICFGADASDTVMGTQMAAAYFGFTVAPPIFGALISTLTAGFFPIYIGIWIAVFILSATLFFKKVKV